VTATLDTEAFTPPRNGLAQETCASLNTGGAPNLRTTTTGQARIAKACYPSASVRAGLPTRRRYVDTLMATFDGDRSEKERSGNAAYPCHTKSKHRRFVRPRLDCRARVLVAKQRCDVSPVFAILLPPTMIVIPPGLRIQPWSLLKPRLQLSSLF
jgi:hypothetical protein